MPQTDAGGIDPLVEKDDFQQIRGIGESIARALYQTGIFRYADLASLTPQELVTRLRSKVAFITVQRIERDDWLGQAKELARQKEISNANHKDWKEIADFFVSFGRELDSRGELSLKTKVYYSQADKSEEWEGIDMQAMISWMIEHAHLPYTASEEARSNRILESTVEGYPEGEGGDFQIVLSDLWVSQVKVPALAVGQPLQRLVRVEGNLDLALKEDNFAPPESVIITAEVILVSLQTNESIVFETPTIEISTENLPYQIRHDIQVPPPDRYQLYLLVRRMPSGKDPSLLQGPILRVEG